MRNRLILLCLSLASFLGASCQKDSETDDVLIRVRNSSQYRMEQIYVNTSGGANEYGTLRVSEDSEYKVFSKAYSYAYVRMVVNGKEVSVQPTDYVGETPLEPGKYTYVLDVTDVNAGRLSLTLVR